MPRDNAKLGKAARLLVDGLCAVLDANGSEDGRRLRAALEHLDRCVPDAARECMRRGDLAGACLETVRANRGERFAIAPGGASSPRLSWRSVGARSEAYPEWVRELDGKNGAYLIRDKASGQVLYVGESHRGRLYGTLTRHFQAWVRLKQDYSGRSGSPNDPGVTYDREKVQVAIVLTPASEAIATQDALICKHAPRDNVAGVSACDVDDDPPF